MAYTDVCPFCNAPSLNSSVAIVCSNAQCWESVIKELDEHKKQLSNDGDGSSGDNPIIIHCPSCNATARAAAVPTHRAASAYCCYCPKWFPYTYEIGKWYLTDAPHWKETIAYKYIGAPDYWEWITRITRIK